MKNISYEGRENAMMIQFGTAPRTVRRIALMVNTTLTLRIARNDAQETSEDQREGDTSRVESRSRNKGHSGVLLQWSRARRERVNVIS